jgi:flagellar biosynthesis/type III secretory pathway M-ring protein FliF/YscJ
MNAIARPWIGLCFKLLAVIAFIFAFIFFMKMQEEQSENDKLRNQGVVSRALVTEKDQDTITSHQSGIGRRSSGSTTQNDIWVLMIRHVPKSTVKYADFPSKVKEANLPVAPPLSGDPMKDSENSGIMWVSAGVYEKTKVGDMLTVANTPWDSSSPVLVSDVEAFDASVFYPRMAIALFLTLLFWFIGRKISKASMLRGIAAASTVPGNMP